MFTFTMPPEMEVGDDDGEVVFCSQVIEKEKKARFTFQSLLPQSMLHLFRSVFKPLRLGCLSTSGRWDG